MAEPRIEGWPNITRHIDLESNLANLNSAQIDFPTALLIIRRVSCMEIATAIQFTIRGETIPLAIQRRMYLLRVQIVDFPREVLLQLTQVQRDERKFSYRAIRKTIMDMNRAEIQATMERAEWEEFQRELLAQWRKLRYRVHNWLGIDRIIFEGMLWTGLAIIRMTVPDEWAHLGVTEEEVKQMGTYKIMLSVRIRDYFDNNGNSFFWPEEEEGMRIVFEEVFDPEREDEYNDVFFLFDTWDVGEIDLRFAAEEAATTREKRRIAVLALYPEVPCESLATDDQECLICGEQYGAECDDKGVCQPRASTCCPPAKIGSACLLQWFVASCQETCPVCRRNLKTRIEEVARN